VTEGSGAKGSYEDLLEQLYGSMLNELEIIGKLMGGSQPKEDQEYSQNHE